MTWMLQIAIERKIYMKVTKVKTINSDLNSYLGSLKLYFGELVI